MATTRSHAEVAVEPSAGTMRALGKTSPGPGFELRRVPVPDPGPGEVQIRVAAAGICGTDLHIYNWDPWAASRIRPPLVIGHEFCGHISRVGDGVAGLAVGQYVSAEGHLVCGTCLACRLGEFHVCERLQVIGVDRDGAFAEYVVMPARNVWPLAASVPVRLGAIMDPIGNAVHTALRVPLAAQRVLVVGCGPIGLMAIRIARHAGAALVAASDVNEHRLAMARAMGADLVLDARRGGVADRVRDATGGDGADVVLEMSGQPGGIRDGFRALRNGGHAALLGLPSEPVTLDLANDMIFKGATVHGIFGRRMWETWERASRLLAAGLELADVITHVMPMERFDEAFALMRSGDCGKIVLTV